jgi:nucleoside-diphosphate-sugar epimerase
MVRPVRAKDILVTGSKGVIGTVLRNGLEARITPFDLPEHDVTDYASLVERVRGHRVVVHLAWNTRDDNFLSDHHDIYNTVQVCNVYQAASEAGVPRVVVASSIHADRFADRPPGSLLDPYALPHPDSPYGAAKCFMEALGRYYADVKGLEVICLRFGAVIVPDSPSTMPPSEQRVWLSHRDCAALVQQCIDVDQVPNRYAIIYGVSKNHDRIHDDRNPIGWTPLDCA